MRPPQVSPAPPPPPSPAVTEPSTRGALGSFGVAQGLLDHLVGLVDRALHARGDDRLAGEAAAVADPDVDGEDHRGGAGDRVGGQRVRAGRALRLDRDLDSGALGGGLEGLGGHVGVGDAGRAGGDRDQARGTLLGRGCLRRGRGSGGRGATRGRGGRGRRHGGGPGGVRARRSRSGRRDGPHHVADERDHFLGGLRLAQRRGEGGLHERPGQLGEQLEVGAVAAGRRGDQERQVGRAVLGAEVHPRAEPGEHERGLGRRRWCGSGGSRSRRGARWGRWPRGRERPRPAAPRRWRVPPPRRSRPGSGSLRTCRSPG